MWRYTSDRYGVVATLFHWLIAVLFLDQIGLGYLMLSLADHSALKFGLFQWRKSVGFLVLAKAILRLGSSLLQKMSLLLADAPRWEGYVARAKHGLLLAYGAGLMALAHAMSALHHHV